MPQMRRCLTVILVAVVFVLAASPTDAARRWCHKDPVVLVAKTNVSIDVAVYEDQMQYVSGPIKVTVYVPPGFSASLVSSDDGFNGYGESVAFSTDRRLQASRTSIQFRILVNVPASIRMPAQVVVTPTGTNSAAISGRTNSVFTATGSVPRPR